MLTFKRVRWKNLLSTGNTWTEIALNQARTMLISGQNGSGKTTLLEALVFTLYGKPFRNISKPQLINSINEKGLLTEVEFSVGKHEYLVRRGMRPHVFEIIRDGELVNQDAAARDYQAHLEKSILKVNYKAFTQIVALSSANYTPFMKLSPQGRRDVNEDLLDIAVFSVMGVLLKRKTDECRDRLRDVKHAVDLVRARLEAAEEHDRSLRELKNLETERLRERIAECASKIEQFKSSISVKLAMIAELEETVSYKQSVLKRLRGLRAVEAELEAKRRSLLTSLEFYHTTATCPTCKQGIEHDFRAEITAEVDAKVAEVDGGLTELASRIEPLEARLAEIAEVELGVADVRSQITDTETLIRIQVSAQRGLTADLNSALSGAEDTSPSRAAEHRAELEALSIEHEALTEERELLTSAAPMLKDGGVKASVIKRYVPKMNELINKYLAAFDLFVDFQIDEGFSEKIRSRFRDSFSYASFSEGEKFRLDMAVLLTWRAIAKMRNSISTNLLIMDEILDGSADEAAVESLVEVLKRLNSNDNVIVISHRGMSFQDKFDEHIRFEKAGNFSRIAA